MIRRASSGGTQRETREGLFCLSRADISTLLGVAATLG
jgi:hypothetical protein